MKERKQKDSALKQNPVKAPKPAKAQKVPKEKKEKKAGLHSMRFNVVQFFQGGSSFLAGFTHQVSSACKIFNLTVGMFNHVTHINDIIGSFLGFGSLVGSSGSNFIYCGFNISHGC